MAERFTTQKNRVFDNLDEFIKIYGKSIRVYERLIKLGAFDNQHENRQGLWKWYLYKYDRKKEVKDEVNKYFEWTEKQIEEERERQKKEYKKLHPKRKTPNKIEKWKPKIGPRFEKPTQDEVINLFSEFSLSEKFSFEIDFLGSYWSNPMVQFITSEKEIKSGEDCEVEVVIESIIDKKTRTGGSFKSIRVTDGISTVDVAVWDNDMNANDEKVFRIGNGIFMDLVWKERFGSFNLRSGSVIFSLPKIDKGPSEFED